MYYHVSFSFSTFFSFVAIFQVLECAIFIFHVFQCFSPYSRAYSVFVSFSMFVDFLDKIQDSTVCIFHIFTVSCHIPCPTECVSHFTRFSVFLAKFHVLPCEFHIFHIFQFCRPYSMSYSVFFSFSIIFSYHIPCPTVDISKFSTFLSFPRHISRPKVCISHFQ